MLGTIADFILLLLNSSPVHGVCESEGTPRSGGNANANGTLPADTAVIRMAGPICSYFEKLCLSSLQILSGQSLVLKLSTWIEMHTF